MNNGSGTGHHSSMDM
jgi:hypothetical protein